MVTEVNFILRPEEEKPSIIEEKIFAELKKVKILAKKEEVTPVFVKKSIDARHGQVKYLMRYKIYIGEKPEESENPIPQWKKVSGSKKVIIVGAGPAGLFAALRLLENGIKPVIIERGSTTGQRKMDIASISRGDVDGDSNYCFGEGGAGTFSDGKLYTRSNKRGDVSKIYRIFAAFGADNSILTDAHPHIGTDRLPQIINNMREKIIELGGEFHFESRCTGFLTEDSADGKKIKGLKITSVKGGGESEIFADAVILATGHSALDVYKLVAKTVPEALEAKTFAVGMRVEHPRELIDAIQFHGKKMPYAAEYRVTAQIDGRGVYSFCMCPGGFVVPSATAPGQIVVNGMSNAKRNSKWSNAAIVVETQPEDIPEEFKKKAKKDSCPAMAGLYWRTWLEEETARHGQGQKAPAQRLTDFLAHKDSEDLPRTSYTPGIIPSRIDTWFPTEWEKRLEKAFGEFNKNMRGFVCDEALLIASETRTSTPVRILRDKETMECSALKNLYPAGEGSGYSGGIVSSAMDGEKAAAKIAEKLLA